MIMDLEQVKGAKNRLRGTEYVMSTLNSLGDPKKVNEEIFRNKHVYREK